MRKARFDERDHCTEPGWATWGLRQNFIQRICPHWITASIPQNDYCPQAYTRCRICRTAVHWFNDGTHHFGSINRYFADLDR